jgi:hypothetical protein
MPDGARLQIRIQASACPASPAVDHIGVPRVASDRVRCEIRLFDELPADRPDPINSCVRGALGMWRR